VQNSNRNVSTVPELSFSIKRRRVSIISLVCDESWCCNEAALCTVLERGKLRFSKAPTDTGLFITFNCKPLALRILNQEVDPTFCINKTLTYTVKEVKCRGKTKDWFIVNKDSESSVKSLIVKNQKLR
jgi:hypothetical protein